jgi:phytoene dehydrogenase-like protein
MMTYLKEKPTILIVGGGIGGITTAAHLARFSYRVKVFEKNGKPGRAVAS